MRTWQEARECVPVVAKELEATFCKRLGIQPNAEHVKIIERMFYALIDGIYEVQQKQGKE